MKRVWHHPEEPRTGRTYWRGAGELEDTAEFRSFLEREFPHGLPQTEDDAAVSRRGFMKLMGASASLAGFGMAGCERPPAFIVPFADHVEWVIPGKPLLYATAMPRLGGCTPMVVQTHEGRPTHLQGNRLHPNHGNGLDGFAQASILDLYDPDRSKRFRHQGKPVAREEFDAAFRKIRRELASNGGEGAAILVGESTSPTRARLLGELKEKFPALQLYRYEAVHHDNLRRASAAMFGDGASQVPRLQEARRVLTLDCDVLGVDRLATNPVSDFMQRRKIERPEDAAQMNRLYTVEPSYTVTGGMADHRLRAKASMIPQIAALLAREVGATSAADAVNASRLTDERLTRWIAAAAQDLKDHQGEAVVLAGPAQPAAVHVLIGAINEALGAFGSTIDVVQTETENFGSLSELAAAVRENRIRTLIVTTEADPVYDAPAELKWRKLQESIATVIHVGARDRTDTARSATWHVPGTHYLEAWGDVRDADGTYSVVQPMIAPLYDGVSELDFLLSLSEDVPAEAAENGIAAAAAEGAGENGAAEQPPASQNVAAPVEESASPAYLAVRETFAEMVGASGDVETLWNAALRDGFLPNSAYPAIGSGSSSASLAEIESFTGFPVVGDGGYEVVFKPDHKVYDGRFINNAWQQEAPEPVTKLTWDNAALMSISTAIELGIEEDGRMIAITIGETTRHFPALRVPGHADRAITLPLGWGQTGSGESGPGRVGEGAGFNAYPLRTAANEYIAPGASVRVVDGDLDIDGREIGEVYPLALTQEHHSMYGRALVREGTVERFAADPDFANSEGMDSHIPENISLYKPEDRDGDDFINDPYHQWAMTIDLNQCLGCNACLIACQSENNIPVVGKEQVALGREMHWIRMDRYFATADPYIDKQMQKAEQGTHYRFANHWDNAEMVPQPVACQHCELAPCESVCPVNATIHTPDGLNVQAYNRCIGTRYCGNNCPYKARKFNFFDYNKRPLDQLMRGPFSDPERTGTPESLKLQKNPNVTVRNRGVMEKCTYCVQRIQEAKIAQKRQTKGGDNLQIPVNGVRTACQEACPSEAIVFGNLLNPEDDVVATKASPRAYDLLKYLGVRPRTSYLARIKNPNPDIEDPNVGRISVNIH